jgi:uncharacterized protein (DUF2126 family)
MDKCEVEFTYSNTVTRVFESPRVTKPYRAEQWEAIGRWRKEMNAVSAEAKRKPASEK